MIKQAYTILYGGASLTNKLNLSYDKFPYHKKVSSLGSEQIGSFLERRGSKCLLASFILANPCLQFELDPATWAGCSGFLNGTFKSLCITHAAWDLVGLGTAGG